MLEYLAPGFLYSLAKDGVAVIRRRRQRLNLAAGMLLVSCASATTSVPQDQLQTSVERMIAQAEEFIPQWEGASAQCTDDFDRILLNADVERVRSYVDLARKSGDLADWVGMLGRAELSFVHDFGKCKEKMAKMTRCQRMPTRIGLTAAQARTSCWGEPEYINRTQTASHVREQWVYPGVGYLYFDNGILTTIQEESR